jgi:2-methylisocitrate lyase-like PEP mutase family enzyme
METAPLAQVNANGDSANLKPFRPAAAILREMLADPEKLIVCPGVYDGFTARLALKAGFDCLYMV